MIVGNEEIISRNPEEDQEIRIYPNPAKDVFMVSIPWLVNCEWTVGVFDLFGIKVDEIEVSPDQSEAVIDVSSWQKGLYLVRIRSGDGNSASGKVVVE